MADGSALTLAALGGTGLSVLGLAGTMGVGLVFLQAALAKLRHRDLLAGVISNYRLLPSAMVAPAAVLLAPAELVIAIGLLLGGQALAAAASILLLAVFAAAMGINIARGRREIDCGCGRSQLRQPLSWLLVARNLLLAALLVPRLLPNPAPAMADLVVALAGGLAIFVIVQLFNAIGALAASPLATQRR
ncbi:methylamine utilization protein MauE [Novosphingobium fuchskuhlense]|uniref:Methylamine utilization protein MauE n=1 Tax=Novosphingobium fuchskuhlense TaxID=1117702 RepID=A0A117UTX6_9SPHN|nr:MauE/DoxX family redox-associated membrane protein [Novosphingobium fuchskuhlense]KUR70768.1 methylamine utilization protein MauE [Novosphingobium fuchskuhlense]